MSRLADAFSRAHDDGRAALVAYLCAGDPSLALRLRQIAAALAHDLARPPAAGQVVGCGLRAQPLASRGELHGRDLAELLRPGDEELRQGFKSQQAVQI